MDHLAEIDTPGRSAPDREGRMRVLELLLSRQSVGVLAEPAPEGAELDLILDAGLRAPDHGRLRPWRFVLIRGDDRLAWGERLAEAAQARDPATAQMLGERYRAWVRRTPLLIAVGAEIRAGHKIREVEQILSAGAAAMNMLNAIHLLGYAGMWVTGVNTYDPRINALLGFEAPSRLVGFLAVGTSKATPRVERPPHAAHTAAWTD
jgi:nitroreductase